MNVLVVDTEAEIRDELCCFLKRHDYTPLPADGLEAARQVMEESAPIDIVLTGTQLADNAAVDVTSPAPAMLVQRLDTHQKSRHAPPIRAAVLPVVLKQLREALSLLQRERAGRTDAEGRTLNAQQAV